MEKLKCSSCGGHLELEENKEYAVCKHCGARYKLNEDLNINIKLDDSIKEKLNDQLEMVKTPKTTIISIAVIFIIGAIICSIAASIFNYRSDNTFNEERAKQQEESNKDHFNFQFYGSNGTNNAFLLEHTLDEIIQSNKTNERQVALVFEGKETTDEKEIIDIKHSLSGDYEVSVNYDDKGYVNKIIIEKINLSTN